MPYDSNDPANGLSLDELASTLEGFNARKIIIFIESFESHTNKSLTDFCYHPNFCVTYYTNLIASHGKQLNNDVQTEGLKLFTYRLLNGLSGSADLNKDLVITLKNFINL